MVLEQKGDMTTYWPILNISFKLFSFVKEFVLCLEIKILWK